MICSLLLLAMATSGETVRYRGDEFLVTTRQNDIWKTVSIYSTEGDAKNLIYHVRDQDLYLQNATSWQAAPGAEGIWLTYEYGSGSMAVDRIVGPGKNGKWSVWLEAVEDLSLSYPPETVSFNNTGTRDLIIYEYAANGKIEGPDKRYPTNCGIYRWSSTDQKYRRLATRPYSRRLSIPKKG